MVSGLELSQRSMPAKSGASGPLPWLTPGAEEDVEPPAPRSPSADCTGPDRSMVCSVPVQLGSWLVSVAESAVSAPTAMRPAVASTRMPSARLAQPAAERRCRRANAARPPSAIASSGSPAPIEYATTKASVALEPGAVTARLVMAPRIGPAQGVQTRPKPTPVKSPPATPAPPAYARRALDRRGLGPRLDPLRRTN